MCDGGRLVTRGSSRATASSSRANGASQGAWLHVE
jgi:hypothetical protein